MITVFSFNRDLQEQIIIEADCRKEAQHFFVDTLTFLSAGSEKELRIAEQKSNLLDLIYYEISGAADVESLKRLRKSKRQAHLTLLTTPAVSPLTYLKPGIAPDVLLVRPFSRKDFSESNHELFAIFADEHEETDEQKYIVHSKGTQVAIAYRNILYFEAESKKINLRVQNEEYEFYDSIEKIAAGAPEYFVRCHRAFLVNAKKIRKLLTAENMIELDNGEQIPLSRSYKAEVKARIHEVHLL